MQEEFFVLCFFFISLMVVNDTNDDMVGWWCDFVMKWPSFQKQFNRRQLKIVHSNTLPFSRLQFPTPFLFHFVLPPPPPPHSIHNNCTSHYDLLLVCPFARFTFIHWKKNRRWDTAASCGIWINFQTRKTYLIFMMHQFPKFQQNCLTFCRQKK